MTAAPRPLVAAALGLAFLATACGGGGTTTAVDGAEGGATTDLSFTATTIDGEDLALADYTGQDVMLWFWAPW